MKVPRNKALWQSVLRRTGRDPVRVGHWLRQHRRREGLRPASQAARLGMQLEGLIVLSLCRTPRQDCFAEDLTVICECSGADPIALAGVLRREQALKDWKAEMPAGGGWLMAASDAEENESDEEPPPAPEP
jgi:hypothetical protein